MWQIVTLSSFAEITGIALSSPATAIKTNVRFIRPPNFSLPGDYAGNVPAGSRYVRYFQYHRESDSLLGRFGYDLFDSAKHTSGFRPAACFTGYTIVSELLYEQPCEVFRRFCLHLAGGVAAGRRGYRQERISGRTLPSPGGLHRSAFADKE